jgi:sulfate adenylyltransferase (ADP) / ATP adenylyltransferase
MKRSAVLLKKGTLRNALASATSHALEIGALLSIPTEYAFIRDGGVRFFVRILTNLARKEEENKKQGQMGRKVNPFLPYEEDLFVTDVSETHVAVLNKFNVVEHHLLIVTREFEDQEKLLTPRDFEALWACLAEYNSLGFYNGGVAAGASQQHKHLQVVPLPLAPEGPPVPAEPLFNAAIFKDDFGTIPGFPFLNVFVRLDCDCSRSPLDAAKKTFALYNAMLGQVGLKAGEGADLGRHKGPYCFLVTREWMLLVPRSGEFFEGISVNSLGYAGALLVRDEGQMDILKRDGPMAALKSAALPVKVSK